MNFNSLKFDRYDFIALALCGTAFIIWFKLLLEKFLHFGYYDWDLAMYAQAVWALSQGQFHSSIFNTNFLTNHAEYIAFFLAPFYKIFPSAFTLIIFKILALTSGAYIFFLIAKKLTSAPIALLFLMLYLIHPANIFMLIYEFHFENLAIPFIFLMFYYSLNERLIPFIIASFFAAIVKENIALVVLMFSFFHALTPKQNKKAWVIAPLVMGGGIFVLSMFVIIPYLRLQEGFTTANPYLYLYFNNNADQSFYQNTFRTLSNLWDHFTSPLNIKFINSLFIPFSILPFLSPGVLFLGLPVMGQNFFSSVPTMHTMYYHYAATIITFLFMASVASIKKIKLNKSRVFNSLLLFFFIVLYITPLSIYLPNIKSRIAMWFDRLDPIRTQMYNHISKDDSVIASFDFLANLASQKEVYSLHNLWQNYFTFNRAKPYTLPSSVNTAIIDWQCPWLWGDIVNASLNERKKILQRLNQFYFDHPWSVEESAEDLSLLRISPNQAKLSPLVEISDHFKWTGFTHAMINANVNDQILLLSIRVNSQARKNSDKTIPLEFVWHSLTPTTKIYTAKLTLKSNEKIITTWEHPIGYIFNSTPLWQAGQFILERYNLQLPNLKPGLYSLGLLVNNAYAPNSEVISQNKKNSNYLIILNFTIPRIKGQSH